MKAKDCKFGDIVYLYKPNEDVEEEQQCTNNYIVAAIVTKVGRTNVEVVTSDDSQIKLIFKPNCIYYPESMYTHPLSPFRGYMLFRSLIDIEKYKEHLRTIDWIKNSFRRGNFPSWISVEQAKAIKTILE